MQPSIIDRLLAAVRAAASDILGSTSGFGHTDFVVENGELVPCQTTITHKPNPGESFEVFVSRLKITGQWQDGDAVQFVYNNKRLDVVRITRNPPKLVC